MTQTVLVTGATGSIGTVLVPSLATRTDVAVKALVRDPPKARDITAGGAEIVAGGFADAGSLKSAMAGVDTVVLIAPPGPGCVAQNRAVIEAAKAAGVQKIVRISAIKAAEDGRTENTRLHGQCDTLLRDSGLTYVILRPNYFMQNLLMSVDSIIADGVFYAGMGDGQLAMIDVRDVADSAAAAATTDDFDTQVLELSGPESISFHDVAAVVSEVAERRVAYVAISPDDVKTSMLDMGADTWMADLLREYSAAFGDGWGDLVTDNVERLTGRQARSFSQFATEILLPTLT